ncbi:ABC transporter permease [Roseateles oligotrophus]|uniref:ABC transporter permease n=1 Tax=Roseateles oligotrophus TaxID=1769250 RepID=A0ABT2YB34_9BURK|nr:ABC transporter permease [Roseateles oligotrophus]MCV2367508.1 ABC transporter permease [Roseateles oligotrophus]
MEVLGREWARLRASPFDLAMLSWLPLLMGLLLIWTFAAGLPTRLPIGILDGDHSALSRQLSRMLDAAPGLQIAAQFSDEGEMQRALRAGRVYGALVMPAGFSDEIKQGRAAKLALLHNAQFATHSGLIQKDVRTVVGTLSAGIEIIAREKRGQSALAAHEGFEPLRANLQAIYNPTLNYQQFLAAALLPALLHMLAMVAGAWAVGVELRDATAPQWLAAGQGQVLPAVLLKLLPATLLLNGVNLILWLLMWQLGLVQRDALAVLLGLHALMLALYWGLGAFVALASRSLRTALSAAGFITAPAFAFSGLAFPLMAMPGGARQWAEALPLAWVLEAQVGLLQQGRAAAALLPLAGWLSLVTALLLLASAALLKRAAVTPACWGKR